MATPVTLPALGESVTEGTVTRWLKQVGDSVEVDEPLLEVSTDKVDTEIPSPVAGTLLEIRVEEDETVEVGAELAIVGDATESGGSSDEVDGGDAAESEEPADLGDGGGEDGGGGGGGDDGDDDDGDGDGDAQNAAGGAEGDTGLAKAAATASPSGEGPGADGSGVPTEEVSSVADTGSSDGDGTEVTLPALGESVTEGTVTRWLKQVGDAVEVDEALLEVSTDKVDTEIPSPVAGTVQAIKVQEDETVEVGAVLAVVGTGQPAGDSGTADSGTADSDTTDAGPTAGDAGADVPAEQDEPEKQPDAAQHEAARTPADEATTPPAQSASEQTSGTPSPAPSGPSHSDSDSAQDNRSTDGRPAGGSSAAGSAVDGSSGSYVTPLVRKLAAQHDVDLSGLSGTGVGGRIRKQDVLAAAESAKSAQATQSASEQPEQPSSAPSTATPAPDTSGLRGQTVKMSRLRKTIATRMVESLQVSAQLTTVVEVDVTRIARLRTRAKSQFEQREGVKLSFLPFFAKAAVDALKAYPMVNASIDTDAGTVTYHGAEHLGVAVDTERGLLVPVIKDAGDLSIPGLARKIADLATRTRESKIGPDELSGGTFTLTNTGSRGALFDTPIINQPQVAILGTGAVVKRPVVLDDPELGETIGVRQMVYLALTYDHRIVDGADAARFLSAIKARLEEAAFESDLGA